MRYMSMRRMWMTMNATYLERKNACHEKRKNAGKENSTIVLEFFIYMKHNISAF